MSGRNYSEATKLGALEMVRRLGVRGAARETGIDRSTLSRWARDGELDTSGVEVARQQREAAAAANAVTARRAAEARQATIDRTLGIVEGAQERLARLIDEGRFVDGKDVRALSDAYIEGQKLIELLDGRATERSAVIDDTAREEIIDHVVSSMRRALELAGLTAEAARLVRVAFSHALRGLDDDAIGAALITERKRHTHPEAFVPPELSLRP